jgi:hypothetical protein
MEAYGRNQWFQAIDAIRSTTMKAKSTRDTKIEIAAAAEEMTK